MRKSCGYEFLFERRAESVTGRASQIKIHTKIISPKKIGFV
jgi:hypothetical protein